MNRIITFQDLREFDLKNLWELKNPKFYQAPEGTNEALPQYKLRRSGSVLGFLTNYLTPSRLYGLRKFIAWLLWLFSGVLIFGTVYAYQSGSGDMGQVYFTLSFIIVYLLFFIKAAMSRLRRWDAIYTKAIKTDAGTHTNPVIIYDGSDMLLANERIFEMIGDRPIAAFVGDFQNQLAHKEKLQMEAKKAADKEKARLKREKEDKEFNEAVAVVGPLIGGAVKSLVTEGGLSSRAAQSARGTLKTDSFSSRAARAAIGLPPHSSNAPADPASDDIKIEGYTGSQWETCATGLQNNANYIATQMQQIRKSNPRYTKLRAIDSKGRIVDVG
ncbi:MAG: hypothetical protein ABNH53_03110 [Henriciella sp.]